MARPGGASRFIAVVGTLAAALSFLQPWPAAAENKVDPRAREEARALGTEGLGLFEQGKYAEALDRFERANKLCPAPTLSLRAARSLAKLGRFVEASERYLEASRFPLEERAPKALLEAVQQASQEHEALDREIPSLTLSVVGVDPRGVHAEIDGVAIPPAMLGQPQPVDPGAHGIVVSSDNAKVQSKTTVKPGDKTTFIVQLAAEPQGIAVEAPAMSAMRQGGIVALSIGGAGLMMGAFHGALALTQQDALDARCPDRNCPPAEHGAADRYDVSRVLTTVGLILGGVGLAAGTALVLADPNAEPSSASDKSTGRVMVTPWLGLGSVGLSGHF